MSLTKIISHLQMQLQDWQGDKKSLETRRSMLCEQLNKLDRELVDKNILIDQTKLALEYMMAKNEGSGL